MSRVGKAPITIPDGLSVEVSAGVVKVSGNQGELSQEIPEGIEVQVQESEITSQMVYLASTLVPIKIQMIDLKII